MRHTPRKEAAQQGRFSSRKTGEPSLSKKSEAVLRRVLKIHLGIDWDDVRGAK